MISSPSDQIIAFTPELSPPRERTNDDIEQTTTTAESIFSALFLHVPDYKRSEFSTYKKRDEK